jgi:hypothetical protein
MFLFSNALYRYSSSAFKALTYLFKSVRFQALVVILILLMALSGCGGSNDYRSSNGGGLSDDEDGGSSLNPDPNNDTPIPGNTPIPGIPDVSPTPDSPDATPVPQIARQGSTTVIDTEHYSTEVGVASLGLSFSLLESSGGSYELEPIL